jgi:hypothetical protein
VKPLRLVAGGLVSLVAGLVAALGVLLCVTIILLPLGIPLLLIARRLFGLSARLVLPKAVVHPVKELQKRTTAGPSRALGRGRDSLAKAARRRRRPPLRKRMKKRVRRLREQLRSA